MPPNLHELLAKLEFIAMTEENKKICMNNMTFVSASSWVGSLMRAINGESRRNLILELGKIINQAMDAISEYKSTDYLPLIFKALEKARNGIINLKSTYIRDAYFLSQATVMIKNLDLQLSKYSHLINDAVMKTSKTSKKASKEEKSNKEEK